MRSSSSLRRLLLLACVLAPTGCRYDLDDTVAPGRDDGPSSDPCGPAASDPVVISFYGTVIDALDNLAIEDARVDATPGSFARTSSAGYFSIDVDTGGAPLRASFAVTEVDGYPQHRLYFERPFDDAMAGFDARLHSYQQLDDLLYGVRGHPPRQTGAATIVAAANDCDDVPLSGVTIDMTPPPEALVYYGDGPDTDSTGLAYGLNSSTGTVELSITGEPAFTIDAPPGAVVIVRLVRPST